jgi:hypothetical protein
LAKIQNRGFVKVSNRNSKENRKEKEKKLRKEKRAPGAESGLDPKVARGPSFPCAEAVSAHSLSDR